MLNIGTETCLKLQLKNAVTVRNAASLCVSHAQTRQCGVEPTAFSPHHDTTVIY